MILFLRISILKQLPKHNKFETIPWFSYNRIFSITILWQSASFFYISSGFFATVNRQTFNNIEDNSLHNLKVRPITHQAGTYIKNASEYIRN